MHRVLTVLPCVASCSLSDVYPPFACFLGGLCKCPFSWTAVRGSTFPECARARFPELPYVVAPSPNTVIFIVTALESSNVTEIGLFLQTHLKDLLFYRIKVIQARKCFRHSRFKSWYGPAIQVQTLNGLMEINCLSVSDLTRQHSRKREGRSGIEKLEPGQNIYYMYCW
jgi:hypothetical protein